MGLYIYHCIVTSPEVKKKCKSQKEDCVQGCNFISNNSRSDEAPLRKKTQSFFGAGSTNDNS